MTSLRTRRFAAAAPLVLLAAVAACESPTLPSQGPPSELEFSIGGFGGTSHQIVLRGDTLVVRRAEWPWQPGPPPVDSAKTVPTADDWRAFWAAADAAGVRRWRREYADPSIADGEGWGLRLRANGRTWESEGANAYPRADGREQRGARTAAFEGLLAALERLTGADL